MKHFIFFFLLFLNVAAAAQTRTGRDYAVFFYVTDFKPGWAALPETKTEAETLKKELEDHFNFTCELVANPTKQQMLDKIRQYNDRLTENDQVLFFFSMHGFYSKESKQAYLIGKDGLSEDESRNSWLNCHILHDLLGKSRAKHILLALDACYSGGCGEPDTRSKPNGTADSECEEKITRAMRYVGRQYCASGNKDAKTPAKSQFAKYFLKGLRYGGKDGVIMFYDLQAFLYEANDPRPVCGTFENHEESGDFIFKRKDACSKRDTLNVDLCKRKIVYPFYYSKTYQYQPLDNKMQIFWLKGITFLSVGTSVYFGKKYIDYYKITTNQTLPAPRRSYRNQTICNGILSLTSLLTLGGTYIIFYHKKKKNC